LLPELPNFDKRADEEVKALLTVEQAEAAGQLQARVPAARIDVDEILGSPAWVISTEGFLTAPQEPEVVLAGQARLDPDDPHRPIKAFLDDYAGLFGHGAEVLTDATLKNDYVTAHNGLRSVVWQQQLDGIPVFGALLIGHITKRGELVNLSSYFVPELEKAADLGAVARTALAEAPPISAQQAVANAAPNIDENLDAGDVSPVEPVSGRTDKRQTFVAAPLFGEAEAKLAWLPMNRAEVRLCWEVVLTEKGSEITNGVVIVSGPLAPRCRPYANAPSPTFHPAIQSKAALLIGD